MSFYKEQIPQIITNLKIAVKQCLNIIAQEIDADLADDKLHAALKGKRMATEDVKFYAKEIDTLQAEQDGKSLEPEVSENRSKKYIREE